MNGALDVLLEGLERVLQFRETALGRSTKKQTRADAVRRLQVLEYYVAMVFTWIRVGNCFR